MKQMDLVLDEAHKAGVKLIIPIVNQDFGDKCVLVSPSRLRQGRRLTLRPRPGRNNFVGCTTDLTRLRYGLGSNDEARRINFWKDTTMIERCVEHAVRSTLPCPS